MIAYEVLEKIRRELIALKEDVKSKKVPDVSSDFTGIAARINEILALYPRYLPQHQGYYQSDSKIST